MEENRIVLTKEQMGEIAWKIMLEQGLRVPPAAIMRDIGNQAEKSKIPEEELEEFAKALIDAEYSTNFRCDLTDERRNEIALILIKSRYNSQAEKIKPEEAKKARGILSRRIEVDQSTLEAFSAQIMTELYEKAFAEKK